MRLSLILACAETGVIGVGNRLPWHLPEDLKYFKRVTMGKPVIMGRRTFESIGRPLPGRTNIVISRTAGFAPEGVTVVASFDAALDAVEPGTDEAMVIGGAQIYREAMPRADRIYLTEVHAAFDGDAVVDALEAGRWREVSRERKAGTGDSPDISWVVLERRAG